MKTVLAVVLGAVIALIGVYLFREAPSAREAKRASGADLRDPIEPSVSHATPPPRAEPRHAPPEIPARESTSAERNPTPRIESARDERLYIVDRVSSGGTSTEPWTTEATTDLDAALRELDGLDVTVSKIECFHGGCFVNLTHSDMLVFNTAVDLLDESKVLSEWSRAVTGPELEGTVVRNAVILFRPQTLSEGGERQ